MFKNHKFLKDSEYCRATSFSKRAKCLNGNVNLSKIWSERMRKTHRRGNQQKRMNENTNRKERRKKNERKICKKELRRWNKGARVRKNEREKY